MAKNNFKRIGAVLTTSLTLAAIQPAQSAPLTSDPEDACGTLYARADNIAIDGKENFEKDEGHTVEEFAAACNKVITGSVCRQIQRAFRSSDLPIPKALSCPQPLDSCELKKGPRGCF